MIATPRMQHGACTDVPALVVPDWVPARMIGIRWRGGVDVNHACATMFGYIDGGDRDPGARGGAGDRAPLPAVPVDCVEGLRTAGAVVRGRRYVMQTSASTPPLIRGAGGVLLSSAGDVTEVLWERTPVTGTLIATGRQGCRRLQSNERDL